MLISDLSTLRRWVLCSAPDMDILDLVCCIPARSPTLDASSTTVWYCCHEVCVSATMNGPMDKEIRPKIAASPDFILAADDFDDAPIFVRPNLVNLHASQLPLLA